MEEDDELKKLRQEWEEGWEVIDEAYEEDTLYVALQSGKEYGLHRYFKIRGQWGISVDYVGGILGFIKKVNEIAGE